jgi:hypothetical protein
VPHGLVAGSPQKGAMSIVPHALLSRRRGTPQNTGHDPLPEKYRPT